MHSHYIAPKLVYSALAALCVTDRSVVQPRPQPKPALSDVSLQPCSHTLSKLDASRYPPQYST